MPEIIKLADGSEREVPTAEELEALNKVSEEANAKKEELQKQFEETQKELLKLKNKDYNFRKLEELTEEEKKKLTSQEQDLMRRSELLAEKQNKFQETIQESWKNEAMAMMCGNDEEVKKKVAINLSKIKYDASTKEGIQEGVRNAYILLGQGVASVNPLHSINTTGGSPVNKNITNNGGEEWANKQVDGQLAKNFGITDKDIEDYDKFPNKGSSIETGAKTGYKK